MAEQPLPAAPPAPNLALETAARRTAPSLAARIARYALARALKLGLMLVVGVFAAVVALNFGGFVDDITRGNIEQAIQGMALSMASENLSQQEKADILNAARAQMTEAAGLNEPFLERCARWTAKALTFDWGESYRFERLSGKHWERNDVRLIIRDYLPNTLLLAGITNLLLFAASIVLAMALANRFGRWQDKLFSVLSLVSSVPSWIHGLVLLILFSQLLPILPGGGLVEGAYGYNMRAKLELVKSTTTSLQYALDVARHMVLPALAILLGTFFASVYAWRTFFLLHADEDYVELGRAQGLPPRLLQRRYVLRPSLPPILTSFALMVVTFWESTLALESLFSWPGIGALFMQAVHSLDKGVSVAIVVVFAYLLAVTIFVLDILYAVVDPRVRLGNAGPTLRDAARTGPRWRGWWQDLRDGRRRRAAPALAAEPSAARPRRSPGAARAALRRQAARLRALGRDLARTPSVAAGLAMILALVGVSIYTVIAVPYDQSAALYRVERIGKLELPKLARPAWFNAFRKDKLPETQVFSTRAGTAEKQVTPVGKQSAEYQITFTFDYPYQYFPEDLVLNIDTSYKEKMAFLDSIVWVSPDGREQDLGRFSTPANTYPFFWLVVNSRQDLYGGKGGPPVVHVLFTDLKTDPPVPIQGTYQLRIVGYTFEPGTDLDAELVIRGRVYGLAGTDHERRDLATLLFWGAPIALAFGLAGAVGTTLASMLLAAVSAWHGGWVDDLIQRLSEVNLILPALPIAIMVYYVYAKSVWVILGVVVLLSIFGSTLKSYRATFIQVRDAGYVEAARAYGASNRRIIWRYLVPRILPLLIPRLVALIPTYVFLEATLAYLGVSDLQLPTWGRLVLEALINGALDGHYYWALEPAVLLVITGAGFALLGFGLDRVLNPRLRST